MCDVVGCFCDSGVPDLVHQLRKYPSENLPDAADSHLVKVGTKLFGIASSVRISKRQIKTDDEIEAATQEGIGREQVQLNALREAAGALITMQQVFNQARQERNRESQEVRSIAAPALVDFPRQGCHVQMTFEGTSGIEQNQHRAFLRP
jgi:hypothetical protein